MKLKQGSFSSQLLIIALAGILMVLMIQMAKAQSVPMIANASQQQQQSGNRALERTQGQTIQIGMPQKSLSRRLLENTTLNYYHQFLGPTASGSTTETYNVFQSSATDPRSGRAPLQSFQSLNLRHQINPNWAIGATLAAVNGYTDKVTNRDGFTVNRPAAEFFNARAYVSLPSIDLPGMILSSTAAFEAPTSSISKEDEMRYGWVLTESIAFKLPSIKWSAGILGQVYRSYYKNNQKTVMMTDGSGVCNTCTPTQLQTVIVSAGPYVNYRFSDKWQFNSLVTLDWDQKGVQSGSREFNNNLPHRARAGMNYFPQKIKFLTSVGVFAQGLLKYRPDTTAIGADFGLRF